MSALRNICLFIALLVASTQGWTNGLPERLSQALLEADIPREAVSILVQPAEGGSPLLSINATEPMNPASTMKLVTTYAALESLGPAHTWKTALLAGGEIQEGRLLGDMVIVGGGDPYLTLERIWLMQRALRDKGVREIDGNLVLDLSLYELPQMDPGAFDGEPFAAYNALPSPLVASFNAQKIRLVPDGEAVVVRPELPLAGVSFVSRLQLTDGPCNGWSDAVVVSMPEAAALEVVLEGSYPRACGVKNLPLNLLAPPQNFAEVFRSLWQESGGKWNGKLVLGPAPADGTPLLVFESPPLADVIRPLNKYSSNVMTRMLFLSLAEQRFGAPATLCKSVMAVNEILLEQGLNFPDLFLENGAGLSRSERISAHSMGQLLLATYRSSNFSEFESALPIAAADGTLRKRFNGSAFAGHAHLKTGSLKDVRALAGYLNDRNGRRLVVVMFVNHVNADKSWGAQAALLAWAFEGASTPD